nr:immunoglobulin light chain junction region [Macaca mulatta]MOX32322.1 immunoglobulin light chain junction region [Macaca mulatta]
DYYCSTYAGTGTFIF